MESSCMVLDSMVLASGWPLKGGKGMSSRPHPGTERPLHGPLQRFDLEAEVGRLREEGAWHRGQRNSITLRKGEGMNVVLVVMKAGDRLEEHTAPGPFSLSVREGRIRFEAAEAVVETGPESLLTCDAGIRHTVVALSDAVYLLTIVGGRLRDETSEHPSSTS